VKRFAAVCAVCLLTAACPKNGYLVHVEARRNGQLDETLMKALESAAIQEGFVSIGPRAKPSSPPGTIVSSFWRQTASDFRDRVEIYVIWKTEDWDGKGPGVIIDVRDIANGKDATRRSRVDELSRRFEQILSNAFGRENVIVERRPIGNWVF
jgi:hypothetical protein